MTCGDKIPVDEFHDCGEVIGALVLVFEVVRMFPDIDPEDGFCARHDGGILVGGGFYDEFRVTHGEPNPSAPEHLQARCDQLLFE